MFESFRLYFWFDCGSWRSVAALRTSSEPIDLVAPITARSASLPLPGAEQDAEDANQSAAADQEAACAHSATAA